jgi:hypothetical protein
MSGDELTECAGCHKTTPTIHGRCPNCLHPKTAAGIAPARRYRPSLLDFDVDELWAAVSWGWLPIPIGIALVLVGLLLDAPALLVIGGALVALRFITAVLP